MQHRRIERRCTVVGIGYDRRLPRQVILRRRISSVAMALAVRKTIPLPPHANGDQYTEKSSRNKAHFKTITKRNFSSSSSGGFPSRAGVPYARCPGNGQDP